MNKLQKIQKALLLLLKKPSLINLILNSDYKWEGKLKKNSQPKTLPIIKINDLITLNNEVLNTVTFLGGGSMPTDILLLKGLAKRFKNCSYFEIGTWRGESVINVADVAKECYTLNLSKEEILNNNLSIKYANLHGVLSKKNKGIKHLYGNSLNFDFKKLNKKFDLVFIDGNHTYEYIKNDTKNIFKHLIHENSIVVWHDYAYHPEMIRPEVLCGILDGIPNQNKNNLYHVSNTMCAIYINENLKATSFESPVKPILKFKVQIETSKF
ncbi:class I SAM-dependent methyltransferase [uncultured Lutibacter sp.]|uniref:class I SAM-dependent methyltransferase n=1 Tax=uncultured Lutibacter sp. TaxID=437739 RepID=UPI00262BD1E2|nr:class I SAM-dependent methyltransferase [uncultured Lutibacter sp.]